MQAAAGVLHDTQGRVLLAQRPAGKPCAGQWEFPGGKIHSGETPLDALRRELHEELGIETRRARPLIQIHHRYAHAQVHLHVWNVERFANTPWSREGQALAWVRPDAVAGYDLLEANGPILTALRLPPLYLITAAGRYGVAATLARLTEALRAGIRLVQVREPQMRADEYRGFARRVIGQCHACGARVILNAEPELVELLNADGVHLNGQRLAATRQRPLGRDRWVAASVHDAAELARAEAIGADFVVLSPVQATTSHPGADTLGWQGFAELTAAASVPVYALGGLAAADVTTAQGHGGQGVALLSAVWEAVSMNRIFG